MHFWFCCNSPKANPERWTQVKLCCPVDSRDSPAKSRVQTGECLRTSYPWPSSRSWLCLQPSPFHGHISPCACGLFQSIVSSCMQNSWETSLKIHGNLSAAGMLRNRQQFWECRLCLTLSTSTLPGLGHEEHSHHLHFPLVFSPDEVQCQPAAGRIVNIHHWVFLSQHHKTNKKRFRDRLIPAPVRYYISKPNADFEHYLEGWG